MNRVVRGAARLAGIASVAAMAMMGQGAIAQSVPAAPPAVRDPVNPAPATQPVRPSEIGYFTAGALSDRCKDGDAGNLSYCFAYITAVHDSMRAYEIWLGQREFCVPVNTAQADLRRTFLTYLSAYPANRSGQAASVIAVALRQTYPCADVAPSPPPAAAPAPSPSTPAKRGR